MKKNPLDCQLPRAAVDVKRQSRRRLLALGFGQHGARLWGLCGALLAQSNLETTSALI